MVELLASDSVASLTSSGGLPLELDTAIDFISDDDRPTFVLEQSTTPKIIFRNNALNALITKTSHDTLFLDWISTLSNVAGDGTARNVRKIENLGKFAHRNWSSKRVRGAWSIVYCKQESQHGSHGDAPTENHSLELRSVRSPEQPETQERHAQETISPGLQEADNLSSSGSNTLDSHSTPSWVSEASNTTGPLDELVVGWLTSPQLTSDPWIRFLVDHDWDNTAIGPMRSWPTDLLQMYTTILSSTEPRVLYWGNNLYMLYNSAARFLVGDMHPFPLGNPLADVWGASMCETLTGILRSGIKRGKALHNRRHELVITRYGFPETCYFDFVFLPVPSPDGRFAGFVNEFTEVTEAVLQENRQDVCKALLANATKAVTLQELWAGIVRGLESNSKDVSYAVLYTPRAAVGLSSDADSLQLEASFGIIGIGSHMTPALVAALQRSNNETAVLQQRKNTLPLELAAPVADVGIVNTACVLPIVGLDGKGLSAVLVLGLSPRRPFDKNCRQFVETLRDMVFKLTALMSMPLQRRETQGITIALSHQLQTMTNKADRSEQNFTRMVHDAPIGMCMSRDDGYPVYVNEVYLSLLSISRADFYKAAETGPAWRSAVLEEDADSFSRIWSAASEDSQPVCIEFRVKTKSSSTDVRWLESTVQQRCDQNGKVIFLYGWLTDISSRKLTESLVAEKLADALENKRSSENFIDMVSHEMRNPLSSILQLADNIPLSLPPPVDNAQASASVLTADARHILVETAQTITLCAKHQKSIIDDILTFSKLDSQLLVLAPERVQPLRIVESVLKMVKAELDYADVDAFMEVEQSYKDLAVDFALLDPARLSQVIINLVTNAVKFTKDSTTRRITISLAASQTRPNNDDCQVTLIEARGNMRRNPSQPLSTSQISADEEIFLFFTVKDTGCGLTENEMRQLFHRFTQASPKTYKQYGGSGLGLFISRKLAELQGGQIGVSSQSGKGSTFAFYVKATRERVLPTASAPAFKLGQTAIPLDALQPITKEGSTTSGTQTEDLHVLVVEDNAINQKVMAQQLRRLGCAKVHIADHGLDALNLLSTTTFFSSAEPATKIALSAVLLDVEMPVMDGLTCARRIRELEGRRDIVRHVPIIGITANARMDQISECIEAGMDDVLTKPFRIPELLSRVLALVDKHRPPAG